MNIPQIAMPGNKMVLGHISEPMKSRDPGELDPQTVAVFASIDAQSAQLNRLRAQKRFKLPLFAVALVDYLCDEIERAHKSIYQVEWGRRCDPEIEGIIWRRYNDSKKMLQGWLPNLEFKGLVIWFNQQSPGEGTEADQEYTPSLWAIWFRTLHEHIAGWQKNASHETYRCNCARMGCTDERKCNGICGCRGCNNAHSDFAYEE